MNGQGESLMNKTKFITGSIGTKCLPSLLHISVFGMHLHLVFLFVCLTSWHSSVCSCWSASDWCMRSKGHPSCSPGENPHDVNRKRSKLQLAIGIMITCTIYSAYCLCCILKIFCRFYLTLIDIKLLNTVPAFMIKDNMEKAL